ncbi:glycosyltransferase [Changchengzhania lutea]|uniref:glycosyltransferase n=1 Tax=Changchengzhania lutea TaxID=2049305 RepID=UPI00115E2CBF|nr:glycosyltransferase [Changchengzhania lutea]
MMLLHILITRFNIKELTWQKSKNEKAVGDLVWLEKRIDLFLRFCLPSVLNQTSKNFYWLIFFEEGTQRYLAKVLEELKMNSFIIPIFVNGMDGFNTALRSKIHELMPITTSRLITTRLDNDDAIHKDFIENIQKASNENIDKMLLDFSNGLCLYIVGTPKLAEYKFPKNQFISLVEEINKEEQPKFVFSNYHHDLDKAYSLKTLPEKAQWLQIVHEDNLINTFKGELTFEKSLEGYPDFKIHFPRNYSLLVIEQKVKRGLHKLPGYYFFKNLFNPK